LARVAVEDVWCIGRNRARLLKDAGIKTARDLRSADDRWIRKHMNVVGLRIVHELRGTSCLPFDQCPSSKKSITVSRSFGCAVDSLADVREAVALYVSRAAEKLRRERLAARVLMVFLATNRFSDAPQYSPSVTVNLPVPTDVTPELIRYAHEGVERAFRPGYQFKKAGVMLVDLVPASPAQAGLFDRIDRARARRVMNAIDMINRRMGPGTIRCAAVGFKHPWSTRLEKRSSRYTTNWNELLTLPD
jgi:DNA polymerase V